MNAIALRPVFAFASLKAAALAAVTSMAATAPLPALAATQDGVICGADSQAVFAAGVLKCRLPIVTELPSLCPPGMTLETTGSDVCKATVAVVVTKVPSSPGAGATGAVRVINPSGPDIFRITNYLYSYPVGAVYIGNAEAGVRCPSEFSPVQTQSGRGLRCEQVVVKKAVCDIGWSIDRRSGRDLCYVETPFGRNVGNYTIPTDVGYLGVIGDPETHGWNLDKDRSGSTDYWVRETKEFRFPVKA
jgi:hypothetical protein